MELRTEIERVVRHLHDLDQASVRREAGELHSALRQQLAVRVVELVAMAVPLEHDRLSVRATRERAGLEHAGIASEAHRAALVGDVALLRQQIDHGMRRERVELGRVRILGPEGRARELDDHALHAHAEAERRNFALAAEADGLHFALDAAVAEATGYDDPVEADQRLDVAVALELLAVDPDQLDVAARGPRGVLYRLGDREIRVRQLDVLAHQPDRERDPRAPDPIHEEAPLHQIGFRGALAETELFD